MLAGNKLNKIFFLFMAVLTAGKSVAQVSMFDEERRGSLYIAIGSSKPTFRPSTINITQGSAGSASDYTLDKVAADTKTNKATGFGSNIKVGYFFDYEQNWAVELSYEPVKYHVTDAQIVTVKGTVENNVVDTSVVFSEANGYFYNLDGSNMISVNLVRRFELLRNKKHTVRLDALAKAGAGPVMPHVYNSIGGKVAEYPSFQLGGWNAGIEAALRVTLFRHVFVEGAYKYARATYTDVGVYTGTATQKLGISQVIFSAGYTFATTKRNPLFTPPADNRPALSIKPIYSEPLDTRE